jgi:hypothetical protein
MRALEDMAADGKERCDFFRFINKTTRTNMFMSIVAETKSSWISYILQIRLANSRIREHTGAAVSKLIASSDLNMICDHSSAGLVVWSVRIGVK